MTVENENAPVAEATTEEVGSEADVANEKEGREAEAELAASKTAEKTAAGTTAPAAGAPAAYTPNYKFKALNEEKEFDDWVRGAIKDKETEEKARALFAKAHGMEFMKTERDDIKGKYGSLEQRAQQQDTLIRTVTDRIAKKDFDAVFQGLGINENDLLMHAAKILQIREMTPDQRQAYNQSQQSNQRAEMLEYQNQMLTQNYQTVAVKAREQELDWTLQRPDFAQIQTAYDSRVGVQGAFKNVVIERAKYHAFANGQDLTPEQVTTEVINLMGGPQAFVQSQNQVTAAPVVPEKKTVMTNIQGRGTSPAKKVYKSLAELKKLSQERQSSSRE